MSVESKLIDALALLTRAADQLQDYCAEVNSDMNDSLAMEIEKFLMQYQYLYENPELKDSI